MQSGNCNFVTGSKVYQMILLERDEVFRLKWIESEKVGYDIGIDHATFLWLRFHRSKWLDRIKSE